VLRDLKLRKPNGDFIETVGHLPFAEEAINKSAVKLLKEKAEVPDYEKGYGMWGRLSRRGKQASIQSP
jgi:hypothetical protein